MEQGYNHLRFQRVTPVNSRRTRRGWPRIDAPEDPVNHARSISSQVEQTEQLARQQERGFDPRLLLKIEAIGVQPEDLESIGGLQVISQEDKNMLVLFATEEGLNEFKHRLAQITRGEVPTRKEIFYAIKGVEGWTSDDRKGTALSHEGIPEEETFIVDVELWPLERGSERQNMCESFSAWCRAQDAELIDRVNQETIIMYRIRVTRRFLDKLLLHRDVRMVDLPPRYQLAVSMLHLPIQDIPETQNPPGNAPGIAVLDSGVTTGHPLLSQAIGDAQSFIPGLGPEDENGHGTMVAGHALYGDILKNIEERLFIPQLHLFSGRVLDQENRNNTGFLENHVINAVKYFVEHYNCRIFNLSVGDSLKPYLGGHVRGLAAVLDELARQYGALFVVSTGNFNGTDEIPSDWRGQYPDYLFSKESRIIDPAPALNVLTVGSLARFEQPRMAQRYPTDPGYQPVSRCDQPSPFTRTGPGPAGAIKPEVVEYGGNCSVDLRTNAGSIVGPMDLLGEVSMSKNFATGNLFVIDRGTSFAAPKIAHLAGQLQGRYPEASSNLLRALIVAHSRWPEATKTLLENDEQKILKVIGYGKPDAGTALYSFEHKVTLISEEEITGEVHHYYEIPLPEDFLAPPARRPRRITVALSHMPMVRRTRITYRGSTIGFRVVKAQNVDEVTRIFRRTSAQKQEALLPEAGQFRPTPTIRNKGTVQAASWDISQIDSRWGANQLYIVVTRSIETWAEGIFDREPYALVVILEDMSSQQVRYYTQIEQRLRLRMRT